MHPQNASLAHFVSVTEAIFLIMSTGPNLKRFIEDAVSCDEVFQVMHHVDLNALKDFATQQVQKFTVNQQRATMYSAFSINDLLPRDALQRILSFTDSSSILGSFTDASILVCKQWKRLVQRTESRALRALYRELDQRYDLFQSQSDTFIWDGRRTQLHDAEKKLGIRGMIGVSNDLTASRPGDTILVVANWRTKVLDFKDCDHLRFIGFKENDTNHRPEVLFTQDSPLSTTLTIINCNVWCMSHCRIGESQQQKCGMLLMKRCHVQLRSNNRLEVHSGSSLVMDQCRIQDSNNDLTSRVAIVSSPWARRIRMTRSTILGFKYGIVIHRASFDTRRDKGLNLEIVDNRFKVLQRYAMFDRGGHSATIGGEWYYNECNSCRGNKCCEPNTLMERVYL